MSRKTKKDWDLEALLSVVGFVFELVRVVVKALRVRNGTINHLRRLLKESALVDQVFDLIVMPAEEPPASLPAPLGSETLYTVPVTYAPLPPIAELEQEFSGKNSVSIIFDGRPFETHPSCVGIDQTPGQREMLVKHFGREIGSEDAISEMDAKGYRPATHLEARDFAKAYPELQREFWIVVLGAFALRVGSRCVAVLGGDADERFFGYYWFDVRWVAGNLFLFVRK